MDIFSSLDIQCVIESARRSDQLWLDGKRRRIQSKPGEYDAWEFQNFAKQDLAENTEKGKINALSNAKRAIDCRVDELLKLLNLKYFSDRDKWGLPYKMLVLNQFDIPAPDMLKDIAKKRNELEHKHAKPEEIKYLADVTELFLKATDKYLEHGFVSFAAVTFMNVKDIEDGTWDEITEKTEHRMDRADHYKIEFNLEIEQLKLTYQEAKVETKRNKATRVMKSNDKWITLLGEPATSTIAIRDCNPSDIKELMQIIMHVA